MNIESEIPTAVFMKIQVFWDITLCQAANTDISEEVTASTLVSKYKKSKFTIKIGYITYITTNRVGSQWEMGADGSKYQFLLA